MKVDGDAALLGETLRLAALGRDTIDMPEKVEENPATVRGNVNGHPGSLLGSKVDRARLSSGASHIPGCLFALGGDSAGQSANHQGGKQQRKR